MKIYINGQLVTTEILPTDTPTFDETLETFSFTLKATTTATPYAPMQTVTVNMENDDNNPDIINLVIVSDSVTTFSLNPLRYKHTITCIQNTRELSKHLVRNSVFSQPAYLNKKAYNAQSKTLHLVDAHTGEFINDFIDTRNQASEPLVLSKNEKIKKTYIKFNLQYFIHNFDNDVNKWNWTSKSLSEILSNTEIDSITETSSIVLRYKNANNQTLTQIITPADLGFSEFPINDDPVELPLIKTLADQGCNNFEILFANDDFILPVITSYESDKDELDDWMVQIELIAETYYNSAYDVLNLLIERQKQEDDRYSKAPLFSLPTRAENQELFDLLTSTVAPNFTFTQLTMYECVAEVFRLFDAIFTMDANGTLGIEYFNEQSKTPLANPQFTGKQLSLGEEKYTNGLVAYYQDGRIEETFPEDNSFAHLRSEELGVPAAQDHSFIVPHPIQNVIDCWVQPNSIRFSVRDTTPLVSNNCFPVDISKFVLEEELWSLLDVKPFSTIIDLTGGYAIKQANTIYFKKNTNAIQCAYSYSNRWGITHFALKNAIETALCRMAGVLTNSDNDSPASRIYLVDPDEGEWGNYMMKVHYTASVDGRVQVESIVNKYDGETLVDQANGAVDLNNMGLNMFGLSLKMGEPTLNATHKITKWNNRIKVGDIINFEGGNWLANVCSYTFIGGYIQGKISFVKNYNALALRTQLLREKRISNISRELTIKSEDNYIEYIYYTSNSNNIQSGEIENIAISKGDLSLCLLGSFGYKTSFTLGFGAMDTGKTDIFGPTKTYLPLAVYGSGNMICFEFSYSSPISAGNKTVYEEGDTWWESNTYFTSPVKYTDDEGFLEKATIEIIKGDRQFTFDTGFPTFRKGILEPDFATLLQIPNLKLYKQPNEVFALNYELCFLPYEKEKDFIGNEFINHNFFTERESKTKKLYLYYSNDESFKYSILDTEGYGNSIPIQTLSRTIDTDYFSISLAHAIVNVAIKNWAICDDRGKILFASNTQYNTGSTAKTIYFVPRHSRLS